MTEFKKHDRVCWLSPVDSQRLYGYVQGKLRALYIVIDDEGKEWFMYPGEMLRLNNISINERINQQKNNG